MLVRQCLYENCLTLIESWEKLFVNNLRKVLEKILEQNDSLEHREIMTARSYPLFVTR